MRVEGAESNHYLFPRVLIHTPRSDIFSVIRAADPKLKRIIEMDAKMTMHEIVRILSRNPEQAIGYEFQGKWVLLRQDSEMLELVAYDLFWHKTAGHRPVSDKCVWSRTLN